MKRTKHTGLSTTVKGKDAAEKLKLWSVSIRGASSRPEHLESFHVLAPTLDMALHKAVAATKLRELDYVQIGFMNTLRGEE